MTSPADDPVVADLRSRLDDRERELAEARAFQAATDQVLRAISRSTFDLNSVLEAILESAMRLCGATRAHIFTSDGKVLVFAVGAGAWPGFEQYLRENPIHQRKGSVSGRAAAERRIVHVHDVLAEPDYEHGELLRQQGFRTVLAVPMLKEGTLLAVLAVLKSEVDPFTDKQIALLESFADQAAIAIQNAHLVDELQQSTRVAAEALEQQTATADVLKVISRSAFDLQTVLDTLTRSAAQLCEAEMAGIAQPKDGAYYWVTSFGFPPDFSEWVKTHPMTRGRDSGIGRVLLEGRIAHIPDVLSDPDYAQFEAQKLGGFRTLLAVPLLREGTPIGVIVVTRRTARPFTDKQIELVTTFADQGVIAIENVRLFTELEARNQDLTETLEQQTATSEVLKVISRSTFDLQQIFETVAESAVRLCEADKAFIYRFDGELLHVAVAVNASDDLLEFAHKNPVRPGKHSGAARAALERQTIHIADITADPEYTFGARNMTSIRTLLAVPMLKGDVLLGVMLVYRPEVRPFTDKQIALLETFADQAAIAIENARLLNELRESLQQQTATADVLKVISQSAFDLSTVLKALVEAAARLCEADQGTIAREQDGEFRRVVSYGFSEQFNELITTLPVARERGTATGRALMEGHIVHIPDVQSDPEYTFVEAKKLGGFRTILAVPMLREGVAIGILALTRIETRPFTEKQIELVSTFADQAAIAIENVRLFESVEARTRELARSLDELRTAQDRLVQTEKLASLGQLTAGIAHEIKNPLNFVNNFSAVSIEFVDELQAALRNLDLNAAARDELDELAQMLRSNLDRIVQHGKRADSIVKNMLLHARQGSDEHRTVSINAIVEESLNLAYHGARAERQGFNITLESSLDPAAGEVDIFPQEITRVLLNLISNGFYAAMKRKAEDGGGSYEPTLKAGTRDLGDSVEITIRDNGTGIPPEVRERLFSPFFTTKPVGEGTGLGLSISHDIVVKQHAGSIEVETRPGEFTEFRIILPRSAMSRAAGTPA